MELEAATENTAAAELLATIADRKIKRKVHKLLQLGQDAVQALGELDVALYLKEDGEQQLQIVADALLSHFRRLLEYVAMVAPATDTEAVSTRPIGALSMREMIAHRAQPEEKRWESLALEMSAFQYGLGSELKNFERRFAHALASDNKEQAVRDLNDAATGLMDGVFALMTTVYECFLGYAEPERMIPGHRSTLGKALAVRRSLAELRRVVSALNLVVQDPGAAPAMAEASYERLVATTIAFVDSDVFFYLRGDTRRDFAQLRETLETGNAIANRLDCEGFDKYLDSLSFVSQRGVLIKHDTDLKTKMAEELERALKFAALLPEVVCDVVEHAFEKAQRLVGLSDDIDALALRWAATPTAERTDPDRAVELCRRLLDLVRPAPRRPATNNDLDEF